MSKYLVVNFDRKEYLRPEKFGELADLSSVLQSCDGILMALIALLSDGNGRGGGDLRSESPVIGTWAGARIALIDELVTDSELSEPGMEHLPLQKQLMSLGRDLSGLMVEVIGNAEKNYSTLYLLNPRLTIPLPYQRALGDAALTLINTPEMRKKPLTSMGAFFSILGVSSSWSTFTAKSRLDEGLLKTAEAFGSARRYVVKNLTWEKAKTSTKVSSNTVQAEACVKELTATLVERSSDTSVSVTFKFGPRGHSPAAVFKELFPDVVFEKTPSLADSVTSAEVAKLLSMIPNLEA